MRISDWSSDVCSSDLSRAAYKLIELDEKFGFLKKARAVVDLGITPGGWSQVVRKANARARVAGIDLLACEPIEGVAILEMDFMDDAAPEDRKSTRLNSSH